LEEREHQKGATRRPRCAGCGDVIGIYEPVVLVIGDAVRATSLAAEPGGLFVAGVRYHSACHQSLSVDRSIALYRRSA
jgi:hypothetical protein